MEEDSLDLNVEEMAMITCEFQEVFQEDQGEFKEEKLQQAQEQ